MINRFQTLLTPLHSGSGRHRAAVHARARAVRWSHSWHRRRGEDDADGAHPRRLRRGQGPHGGGPGALAVRVPRRPDRCRRRPLPRRPRPRHRAGRAHGGRGSRRARGAAGGPGRRAGQRVHERPRHLRQDCVSCHDGHPLPPPPNPALSAAPDARPVEWQL